MVHLVCMYVIIIYSPLLLLLYDNTCTSTSYPACHIHIWNLSSTAKMKGTCMCHVMSDKRGWGGHGAGVWFWIVAFVTSLVTYYICMYICMYIRSR